MTGKLHKFKDTTNSLTHTPQNAYLSVETSLALYYVSDADNKQLWKYVIATGTDSQLDVDPSDSSGDNKSRDLNIIACWYDSANTKIWFVDCANPGDDFDVWYLDTSDDTVTEVGTSAGQDAASVVVFDIFVYGANTYVMNYEERTADEKVVVWDVDTAPFTEKQTKDVDGWFAV